MYRITQKITIKKKHRINKLIFGDTKIHKVYKFKEYKKALIFALSEGINIIECIISPDIKPTKRIPYLIYMNVKQFTTAAKNNPLHYLGHNKPEAVNIERFYYYLVESGKLQKLKKYI